MKKNILVLAHDVGGAELLSSMALKEKDRYNWTVLTPKNSSANAIFKKMNLNEKVISVDLNDYDGQLIGKIKPDYIFSGTGWNNFEISFIQKYNLKEIPIIAFLDHWINYRERFGYPEKNWENNLPNYIAVGDSQAYRITQELSLSNILKVRNYYFSDLINKYNLVKEDNRGCKTLLFISQTVKSAEDKKNSIKNFNYIGQYEEEILTSLLNNFKEVSERFGIDSVTIRLHPSEEPDKYLNLRDSYKNVKIIRENPRNVDILKSLSGAGVVIGLASMPLFISCMLKIAVIFYLPEGMEYTLPIPSKFRISRIAEIEKLNLLDLENDLDGLDIFEKYDLDSLISKVDQREK